MTTFLHNRAIFIFRQDLRTIDNTGLRKAVAIAKEIVPIFIIDTEILKKFPQNDTRLGFLIDSLQQLRKELKSIGSDLHVYHGNATELIPALVQHRSASAIVRNNSYGANSKTRDLQITSRAQSHNIDTYGLGDYLLVEPDLVEQRKVFTPFYKLWMGVPKQYIPAPAPKHITTPTATVHSTFISLDQNKQDILHQIGGADQEIWHPLDGRKILETLPLINYDEQRNFPSIPGTSRLSPHLAFGTVSIREAFHAALNTAQPGVLVDPHSKTVTMDKKIFKDSFISELAWREFWHHIAHYFPTTRDIEFQEKRQNLAWVNKTERFEHRKNGTTGYPIVDAAMRQLKAENWMHGRTRMIVASFLTKDLLIDRRRGEEHFKNYLLDYDKAVNMGNRQRSASVGADPKPLRIFSPLLQAKRFDPDGSYITHWIPELTGQPIAALHDPLKYRLNYIAPIVDHSIMQRIAKVMYKKEDISGLIS